MACSSQVFVSVFHLLIAYQLVRSSELFPGDLLTPYLDHGSKRFSRDIQECQHVSWVNETFEVHERASNSTIPLQSAGIEIHRFADSVRDIRLPRNLTRHLRHYAVGTIAFVDDPYYMLSVVEPGRKDGCKMNYFTATRSTVSNTVSNRPPGCRVAVNAGYFKVTTGECLGNIVSDGRVVQTSNDEQNANFGIRQDGSIVVGYIPDSEITNTSNPFRQLVSGVVWLVKNGTNFVNESMQLECTAHEDTGRMETFVNVLSARTAVGHDNRGRVIIAQVDGQTHRRGVNLWQFADLLIAHGVVNAINLDGGGSSTFVQDGLLVSYPSDHCWGEPKYRCQREVSTVLCAHDVQCLEPNCNEHGSCDFGHCSCDPPWTGETCDHLNCSETSCSNHGNCSEGVCQCEAGWMGPQCNQSCPSNRYGPGCASYCWCYGRSYCHQLTGECLCPPGYYGYGCWRECDNNRYGQDCKHNCTHPNCSGHGVCSPVNGSCLCEPEWTGADCNSSLLLEQQLDSILSSLNSTKLTNTTILNDIANTTVLPVELKERNATPTDGNHTKFTTLKYTDKVVDRTDLRKTPDCLSGSRDSPSTPDETNNRDSPSTPDETNNRDPPSTASQDPITDCVCPTYLTSVFSRTTIVVVIVMSLCTVLVHAVFCLWTHKTLYKHLLQKLTVLLWQQEKTGKTLKRRRKRKRKAYFVPLTQDSSSDCSL